MPVQKLIEKPSFSLLSTFQDFDVAYKKPLKQFDFVVSTARNIGMGKQQFEKGGNNEKKKINKSLAWSCGGFC